MLASPAALAAANAQSSSPKRALIELRYFMMRNSPDNQMQRVTELLQSAYIPAVKRAGVKTVGAFRPVIAENAPFLLLVMSYPSFDAMEKIGEAVEKDDGYLRGSVKFTSLPGQNYVRMERQLMRAFETIPDIEVPKPAAAPRIFELRTYASNTRGSLKKKISMFDTGEIAIFRKTGLQPVFFGDMLLGDNLPNLTYMLTYDNLAAREKNWATFVSHPEWLKLRATPGFADAEIVSNISNSILSPLPFSDLK